MLKVLVPFDGSPNSMRALRHVVSEYERHHDLELHLLHVQPRLSHHVSRFLSRRSLNDWYQAQGLAALADARALLAAGRVPYQPHLALGDRAREICRVAAVLAVHHIVMGAASQYSLTRMLEDSTTHQVLNATRVPVEVVPGDAVARWKRWGLPAGVLGLGGLALLAMD